jgi:nitrite reductase/ring-hydroxylating ferredoxin subunit
MAWTRIASAEDLDRAKPWLAVSVEELDIAVAAVDGSWYAVEDRCTHAGCPFTEEADLIDGEIVCNCHGSEFDVRSGSVVRGPAERPLRMIPVRIAANGGLEANL